MHVSEIITRKGSQIYSVGHKSDVSSAIAMMARYTVGSVLVHDEDSGELVGLIAQSELLTALSKLGPTALTRRATTIMQNPVPFCRPDDDVASILTLMTIKRCRHTAVIDEAGLTNGLVSIGDLVAAQLAEARLEAGVLRDMARSHLLSA